MPINKQKPIQELFGVDVILAQMQIILWKMVFISHLEITLKMMRLI